MHRCTFGTSRPPLPRIVFNFYSNSAVATVSRSVSNVRNSRGWSFRSFASKLSRDPTSLRSDLNILGGGAGVTEGGGG